MKNITLNLQRIAYLLVILTLSTYILIVGKSLLSPIAFALLFTFLLIPICRRVEKWITYRPIAIIISMITALLPVLIAIAFFSYVFTAVVRDMPSISDRLRKGIGQIFDLAQEYGMLNAINMDDWLRTNLTSLLDTPLRLLANSLSSSTATLAGILLSVLFTFFLLLYRTSFKNYILSQFSKNRRDSAGEVIKQIQVVIQEYLFGLLLVIVILGILNSLGLWLIGIDYPAFWGFLAALLAIIPYIGTTLGGIFPFIYALATTGTLWQPAAVILLYVSVQSLEGNVITPKVVGSSVRINPLAAIIFLFLGGLIWGIAGLILALPAVAVLKVLFEHITPLKPISELLSSHLYKNSDVFFNKYDEDKYRIMSYFSKQQDKKKSHSRKLK